MGSKAKDDLMVGMEEVLFSRCSSVNGIDFASCGGLTLFSRIDLEIG